MHCTSGNNQSVKTLYSSPYMVFSLDGNLLRMTRSSEGYPSIEELTQETERIKVALEDLDPTNMVILVDVREAPLRNDAGFENAMSDMRAMTSRCRRTAVLVKTAVGELQTARLARGKKTDQKAFMNEAEALAFLQAKP